MLLAIIYIYLCAQLSLIQIYINSHMQTQLRTFADTLFVIMNIQRNPLYKTYKPIYSLSTSKIYAASFNGYH
jgi:hypothetical protein